MEIVSPKNLFSSSKLVKWYFPLSSGVRCSLTFLGIVENKYKAVIPKNYLVGINLNELSNKNIKVSLEKINNGIYEAKPIFND